MLRTVTIVAASTLSFAFLTAPPDADADPGGCPVVQGDSIPVALIPQGTDAVACGLVGVYAEWPAAVVEIPGPGTGVGMAVDSVDVLRTATYRIEVDEAGGIEWSPGGEGDTSALAPSDELTLLATDTSTPTLDECTDSKYNLSTDEPHWTSTPTWYIDLDTVPAELTQAKAVDAIRAGVQDVRQSNPNCTHAYSPTASSSYGGDGDYSNDVLGESAAAAAGNNCVQPAQAEAHNIVGFGDLNDGTLARTCWYYQLTAQHPMTSADIKINKNDYTWTVTPGAAACSGLYDLESVMAHEFGHFYGLWHVSEAKHGELTMSTQTAPCDKTARTFGLGDMKAMEVHY